MPTAPSTPHIYVFNTPPLNSIHSLQTGSYLGMLKTAEKIRERFYRPGLQDDIKLFINRCKNCQKRANPTKTDGHFVVK